MKKLIFTFILTSSLFITESFCVANAGIEQTVGGNTTVQLDGNASTLDYEGEKLKYSWKQLKKRTSPRVILSNPKSATPTFIAPEVNETQELLFRLKTVELYDCKLKSKYHRKGSHNKKGSHGKKGSHNRKGSHNKTKKKCKKFKTYDSVSIFVTPMMDNNNTDTNDTNDSGTTVVSGTITDTNGTIIAGATITINGQTVISDTNGTYMFHNIASKIRTTVDVTHPQYLSNSRIVDINTTDIQLNIVLDTPKAMLTFDATTGATVQETGGASVLLPINGYIDENGNPYTGMITVKMSYHAITTQSGRDTFPGTFEGKDSNGSIFPIQSYGFMNVELSDPQGNVLNLDGNSTATLTFPRDRTLNTPSTVPLWYYDKSEGYWIQDGQADNTLNYNTYVGTVTHFTSWNLDAPGPSANFKGCVEDINGTRVPNALVQFRSANWDSYLRPTDMNGTISVSRVLAETDLTVSAYKTINNIFYSGTYPTTINLADGESRVQNSCIVLQETNVPHTDTITITGNIKFYNTQYSNEVPTIVVHGITTGLKILDTSITEGDFSLTIPLNNYDKGFNVYSPGCDQSKSFFLKPDTFIYDVGQINFIPVC